MKNVKLFTLLTLLMTILSFQSLAQNISTVIISAVNYSGTISIQVVKPDYTVGEKFYVRKDKKVFFVEVKKILDSWINEGFTITHTESYIHPSTYSIHHHYILKKEEE
ncbi:hypothetical protein [Brumimicrobium oceani]|uniref:Uncharacterized protein n=1 Tax=Brumimicrobium oceani TaxID=2100725 RepID=A0A2U2X355_9FLAO|nr:hypothetical protein [Brumimicrobium oceani]PWH82213.1 hypothetical protein DIT68_13995 [Brumimicrobium oceani]